MNNLFLSQGGSMKKTLLSMLATLPVFASNLNVNSKNVYTNEDAPKNKSHWIFSLGATGHRNDLLTPAIEIGFGYQSKLEEDKYFQAQRIEITGGASLDGTYITRCTPKFSGLHYFNTASDARRAYFLLGTGIHGYSYWGEETHTEVYTDNKGEEITKTVTNTRYSGQTSIIASLGLGIELGMLSGTINNFEVSLDQPALFFGDKDSPTNSYAPFVKIAYIVGF